MMRRIHLVVLVALLAVGTAPAKGVGPGTVSGQVRDSGGVPQIGAIVQLLRADMTVVATVSTNDKGQFRIPAVFPGRYAVKAMGVSYLPALRENVHVRAATVVNLTLNTLYEVMQWLPSEPRSDNARQDDWAWTLRSTANRPLLRWLEDGPLLVVSDGTGAKPRLKARLMATGQEGTFGESGERISASVEETPSDSRELLARVDFSPDTDAGMESMLGFRQDLGYAGSVQSVAAISMQPEMGEEVSQGLDEAGIRTWETMRLGDEFDVEAGSTQVLARFAEHSADTVFAALPFATVGWHDGNSTVRYRLATELPGPAGAEETEARAWLPAVAGRDGRMLLEHGIHQEIGWERWTDASGVKVAVFTDHIDNPVMEAAERNAAGGGALVDAMSGMLHAAGPGFSTAGIVASVERNLPGGSRVRLSYANGDALTVTAQPRAVSLTQVVQEARPRRAQTYTLALSGTLDGTGTRWRASYRWQPEETVTEVAPYAVEAAEPYLNLHLRQPILRRREGGGGIEALLDVKNLLAQGYQPYLLSDGSLLVFAAEQRGVRGGLAFTF